MRALGYLCVRGPASDAEAALEQQRRAVEEFCSQEDHRLARIFSDRLSTPQDGSPGYDQMAAFIRGYGQGFLVLITEAPVLGASLPLVVSRVLELDVRGAQVRCTDPWRPDPLQSALHHFRTDHTRRVRDGMVAKAIQGEALGKSPFGYSIGPSGRLEVLPQEATTVERVFRLYAEEGLGIRRIVQALNSEGVPTRTGRRWTVVGILQLLANPAYLGTYQRFGYRIPRNHPALVAPALFRDVQRLLHARRVLRHPHQREPFLLSGLLLCGFCGSRMIGVTRRQSWRRKDGTRMRETYRYYQCQARVNQGACDYQTHRATDLEQQVLATIRALIQARREGPPAHEIPGPVPARAPLSGNATQGARQRAWERRWLQAVRTAATGQLSLRGLRAILADLEREKLSLSHPGDRPPPVVDEDTLLDQDRWAGMEVPQRHQVLQRLVQGITVTRDGPEVLLV